MFEHILHDRNTTYARGISVWRLAGYNESLDG